MCFPVFSAANDRPVNSCKQSKVQEEKGKEKKKTAANSNDPC